MSFFLGVCYGFGVKDFILLSLPHKELQGRVWVETQKGCGFGIWDFRV